MDELLKVKDLAEKLKISPGAVYRLVKTGGIPCLKLGKKSLRFDYGKVREILEKSSTTKVQM